MAKRQAVPSQYDAGVKICPHCYRMVYNAVRVCPACDFEFYPKKAKPADKEDEAEIWGNNFERDDNG